MIEAITLETAHLLGDALPMMFRLRHKLFIERQDYKTPTLRGMEWDQYDTPAAVYLLWRDDAGAVRGVARLIPTTFPYMIKELWPNLVENTELPARPDVWELSRMGVDRDLPAEQRRRAADELMCACAEFALHNGISAFLMVTHMHLIKASVAAGWQSEALGQACRLGRFPVVAARTLISEEALAKARRSYGITQPVLRIVGEELAMAA